MEPIRPSLDQFIGVKKAGFACCSESAFFIFREIYSRASYRNASQDIAFDAVNSLGAFMTASKVRAYCKEKEFTFACFIAVHGPKIHEVKGFGLKTRNMIRRNLIKAMTAEGLFTFHDRGLRCPRCEELTEYNSKWSTWPGDKARIEMFVKKGKQSKKNKEKHHIKNQEAFNFEGNK